MIEEFAPAKVNLSLRILGRRWDGYHELESLVTFAIFGDRLLLLESGPEASLVLSGEFSPGLSEADDNIVLAAARAFLVAFPGALAGRFLLDKRLPVASGIGGGSSDAAAALRLLARANSVDLDNPKLMEIARALGADVPVCLHPALRMMRGIGHDLGPALPSHEVPALLVNPRRPVETRAVFARLGLAPGEAFERPPGGTENDLAAPAIALEPAIGEILAALSAAGGCWQAGMSGSGATCFGLFACETAMWAAGERLEIDHGGWWTARCAILCPADGGGQAT